MRYVLITLAALLAISCGNVSSNKSAKTDFEAWEKHVNDSIMRAEAIKDSLKRVEHSRKMAEMKVENEKTIARCKPLFKETKDEFSTKTWVEPKSAPRYRNRNGVYCYFGTEDGEPSTNFRFVFQYYADDWLFIENMIFNIDGDLITIIPKMETDCGDGGKIWEWCDENVNFNSSGINEKFIKKIANAKSVKVKMNGRKYYDTRTLKAEQIKSIKDTYEYYLALGGRFL